MKVGSTCAISARCSITRSQCLTHRGRKLKRTGLPYRYQSFPMKELQTLGRNLYDNRDYALQYIEED
jgi:hypothetical protein